MKKLSIKKVMQEQDEFGRMFTPNPPGAKGPERGPVPSGKKNSDQLGQELQKLVQQMNATKDPQAKQKIIQQMQPIFQELATGAPFGKPTGGI